MPIVNVLDGAAAKAIHVRQILGWLRGAANYTESTKLIGLTSQTEYALEVKNNDETYQKALAVYNSADTNAIKLLEVSGGKTTLRPNTDGSVILSIRNFADTADVFTVSTTGASLGSLGDVITSTATQELTNKTITGGILSQSRLSNYLDIQRQASAPSNPASGDFRFYALTGSSSLKYRDNSGVERTVVDETSSQTLDSKNLTTVTMTAPTITGGVKMNIGSAPPSPGVGVAVLYYLTGQTDLRYKIANGSEKIIVDTDSIQTLQAKNLTAPQMTSPRITAGGVTLDITSAPTDPTSGLTVLYALTGQSDLRYKAGNSTERVVVDTASNQTLSTKTLTAPILNDPTVGSGGLILNQLGSVPTTPASTAAVLYTLTSNPLEIRFKASNSGDQKVIVDTDSAQMLSNKTFGAGIALTTPALTGPVVTNYEDFTESSTPAAPVTSSTVRFYYKSDGSFYYRNTAGNITTVLTDNNSTSIVTKSFARQLSLGSM